MLIKIFAHVHKLDALRYVIHTHILMVFFPRNLRNRMVDTRESDLQRDALNRLCESKSPVFQGRCIRHVLDTGSHSIADIVDLLFSLGEPARLETREQARRVIRAHPGRVTTTMEEDLRRNIAGDQASGTFPRSPFGSW